MKDIKATVNLLINIVMGVVLGVTGQVINGQFSLLTFAQSFVLSMGVGYLIGTYVPIKEVGDKVAHICGIKKGMGEYLISTLIVAVSMVILITFFCVFVQAGTAVLPIFLHMIVPFLIVGVIAIEISSYWITKIAITICK